MTESAAINKSLFILGQVCEIFCNNTKQLNDGNYLQVVEGT
jgi:hypothetical protein